MHPPYSSVKYLIDSSTLHDPPFDARGRQQHFIESAQQRKARIEFLKKREWARRVAEWIRETSARQDVMAFGCTGSLAASSPILDNPTNLPRFIPSASSLSLSSTEEEEEPYIIYSSSPSSSMSSLSDDFPTSSAPTPHPSISIHPLSSTIPPIPPSKRTHHRRRSSASLVPPRRRPSLSSIYEVPEED